MLTNTWRGCVLAVPVAIVSMAPGCGQPRTTVSNRAKSAVVINHQRMQHRPTVANNSSLGYDVFVIRFDPIGSGGFDGRQFPVEIANVSGRSFSRVTAVIIATLGGRQVLRAESTYSADAFRPGEALQFSPSGTFERGTFAQLPSPSQFAYRGGNADYWQVTRDTTAVNGEIDQRLDLRLKLLDENGTPLRWTRRIAELRPEQATEVNEIATALKKAEQEQTDRLLSALIASQRAEQR